MAYGHFKDLTRKTGSDKILLDKAFNINKNPKYDRYQRGCFNVYNKFDKKATGGAVKNENMSSKELSEELHKPIIINFFLKKVYSPFIDNIWCADLVDMLLINKFNKRIRFYYMLLVFSANTYEIKIPLKDTKGVTITNTFQKTWWMMNLIANQTKYR